MRVLAIGNAYPPHHLGGYEVVWRGATQHLRADGHEARILTADYRGPGGDSDAEEDPDVHRELEWYWREHRWRSLGPRARLRLERHNARVLDRHLREFRPDVIGWWPMGGMSLGLIERVRKLGVPSVLFVHDAWPIYGPQHDLWTRTWARLGPVAALAQRASGVPTRLDLPRAGRWVFCSRALRDEVIGALPGLPDPAVLAPGVERAFLGQPRERELSPWRWRLLYVGRVVEQKGLDTAIASLPSLPAQTQLRIVGEGDPRHRASLERVAAQLGVGERVRFEGAVPRHELPAVYRQADAVLFPVRWSEPWGLVPLEAMALGRPVVATGLGGSGEYLEDRRNALLFEPGDAGGLSRALHLLSTNDAVRGSLVEAGYETAERHSEERFNRGALAELLTAATVPPRSR